MSPTKIAVLLGILFVCLSAHAQTPSVYQNIVFSRTGQPLAGANVAICLSNPGVSTPPCHDLATTYTDITVGTQCVGSNALTYGTGCSNPGLTDGFGNYIIYASAGQTLWAQISGPRITTYVVPFIMPGGGSGGGGSVGPGAQNKIPKFTSSTTIGDSTCSDDAASPTRCTLGMNIVQNALSIEKVNNPVTGTTLFLLVARDALGRAINAQPTDTNNVIGIAGNGAGTSLSVQIAYSGRASCVFDNQTFIGDWVTLGTSSQCHDAGATEPSGIENVGRVDSQNSGAGTLASVYLGLPDSTNTSTGGGTGIVQPCATVGSVGYFAGAGNTVGCDTAFTTDGAGNPSAKSFTLTGTTAGFFGLGQGSVPSFPQANTAYLYGGTSISTTFGTQVPSAIGSLGQVLTVKTTPDATHMTTDWETPNAAQFCNTSNMPGADLGARIIACDIALGGTYDPTQQGNLAYNTTPTYGVIRVDPPDVGPITTFPVFISAGHILSLGAGVYTNALGNAQPPFQLANDTTLECDGWSTILQNSSNAANGDPRVVATASAYQVISTVGQNNVPYATASGVVVKNCHFQDSGLGKLSTLTATVVLTNCKNCKVLDSWFDGIGVTGVGLIGAFYSGTNCTSFANWLAQYCGNFGDGDEVAGNVFNGTQESISVINNQNVDLHDNKMSQHATGSAAYIDLESNTPKDYMQYIDVHDNIFDCSTPQINTGCFGITMQSVGPNDGHLKLHNNIFYGTAPGTALSGQTTGGISSGDFNPHGTHEVEIYENKISNTSNPAITTAGVDYAYVHDNQAICTGGGIAVLDYTQFSLFQHNRFYSPPRTDYTITSVATTPDQAVTVYTGTFADGGAGLLASQTVNITGFTNSANNGSFGVSDSTTTTLTVYNPAGTSETHAATATLGCSSSLGTDQNNTQINETATTADFNIYDDNVGLGQVLLKGTHSKIVSTQAASRNADGTGMTFQVPTGFANAIPGGITTTPLTAPVLNLLGPTTNACSVVFTNATYFWIVTAVAPNGAEAPSNEVSAIAGGGSGCGKLGWTYVPGAASYNVYRGTGSGGELLVFNVPQSTQGYTDGGGQSPGAAVPVSNTTGGVKVSTLTASQPVCSDGSKNLVSGGCGTVVNLIEAGAVCNGSHDDTAAIQAAYSSLTGTLGGSIIWPPAGNTCILTGSVTLANTQKIHVIGGAVVWQGVPVNATTGTAAESGFNATLTTTSGNWPASFAVNASIKISGCSVTGYNGLGQITSGGAGGTTLSYIVPGAVTGLGAGTGCTAAAIPPVFIYDEDISASTEGFRVAAAGASTPIGAAFSITQNSTYSVVSQANIFSGNEVLGNVTGALNIGFEIAHGTAANPTNDEHKFIGNNVYNASTAPFVIDYFQSVDIHFEANTCYGITNVTISCVIDTAGAGFDWRGGFTASSSLADFYGYGQTSHPITIDSVGSESSSRLAWISQSNETQTGSPCPVNLINDRFATNLLAGDGHIVVYECPGPLNVLGGSYGQFNAAAGDFLWAPSATSPIIPYGSIVGVTSSANGSQGHPLFSVSGTGPPIGNAVSQVNNVYEDSGQAAVPPTTPDINYTINPTQVMDAHSGAAVFYGFAPCGTASATTTLATGATTTDTALNCLPANSIIDAVVGRVTTTITAACTGWELGDATTPARFSSNNTTLVSGTTTDAAHIGTFNNTGIASATTGTWQAAAAKVRITCAGGNPGAGAIRVIVFYHTPIAPTF